MLLMLFPIFLLFLYYAFVELDDSLTLSSQWGVYTNPLNQWFLFVAGVIAGLYLKTIYFNKRAVFSIFLFPTLVILIYPASGDTIFIVTGLERIVYSFAAICICIGVYKSGFFIDGFIGKGLTVLGEISYSLYLLHSFVWFTIVSVLPRIGIDSIVLHVFCSLVVSLAVSYLSYQTVERYGIIWGSLIREKLFPKSS